MQSMLQKVKAVAANSTSSTQQPPLQSQLPARLARFFGSTSTAAPPASPLGTNLAAFFARVNAQRAAGSAAVAEPVLVSQAAVSVAENVIAPAEQPEPNAAVFHDFVPKRATLDNPQILDDMSPEERKAFESFLTTLEVEDIVDLEAVGSGELLVEPVTVNKRTYERAELIDWYASHKTDMLGNPCPDPATLPIDEAVLSKVNRVIEKLNEINAQRNALRLHG